MNGNTDVSNNPGKGAPIPPNIPQDDGTVVACNSWEDSYAYGYPDTTEASRYIPLPGVYCFHPIFIFPD